MTKVSTITPCYNMGRYMKGFLDNLSTQTHKDLEIVLDHNDPSDDEVKLVEDYNEKYDNILHIKVEGVDPIGTSMNRCIENATGEYLCIWNVDDLRTKESLEKMLDVFGNSRNIDFVYGNFTTVNKFKKTRGNYIDVSGREGELKKSMILGPFFMFRRKIIDKIGLFDEQLISAADYDFAMRLARNSEGKHLNYNLGYYLNDRTGLSTKHGSLNELERTVVELRYGLNIINSSKVSEAENSYNTSKILNNNIFVEI